MRWRHALVRAGCVVAVSQCRRGPREAPWAVGEAREGVQKPKGGVMESEAGVVLVLSVARRWHSFADFGGSTWIRGWPWEDEKG